jgi:type IV secretion system protein VirB11
MKTTPSLAFFSRELDKLLAIPGATEVCINRPGEAFVETDMGWTRHEVPELDFEWASTFVTALSSANSTFVDGHETLLSTTMPTGERVNIVHPPNCEQGTIAITIRKPSPRRITHAELVKGGIYREVKRSLEQLDPFEEELRDLHRAGNYGAFMPRAIKEKRNTVASGPTGSGKTTYTNALVEFIPKDERIITIEDVWETRLPDHPNHVHLFYKSDGAREGGVTVEQLLRMTLRMRPDRPILSEIRGPEAFDFLLNVMSGHPGALTSVHASSAYGVIDKIAFLVEAGGKRFTREVLESVIYSTIDVICQFAVVYGPEGKQRVVSEVYYDPERKRKLQVKQVL